MGHGMKTKLIGNVEIPIALYERRGLGFREKVAFALLLDMSPSISEAPGAVMYTSMAARLGTCSISVRDRVHALRDAGLIEITRDDYVFGYRILATDLAAACREQLRGAA
jgi:hypothetical protein